MNLFFPQKVFPVIHRKSEHHLWILHIWINLDTKVLIKETILNFWPNYSEKNISSLIPRKLNINIEFCIFELVKEQKIHVKQLSIFDQICLK